MNANKTFVVVVEDDPQVRILLTRLLAGEGHEVSAVSSCPDARQVIKERKPDLVMLDLGLPGGNGLDLGIWIRSTSPSTAIIILTGKADIGSRVAGLGSCADDYIAKPFDVDELMARVGSVLRRTIPAAAQATLPRKDIHFEGWRLDEDEYALVSAGALVKLTAAEFRLLEALVERPGKVATRAWLLDRLKADADVGERVIDYHICTLKTKLGKAQLNGEAITSVRGVGYKYLPNRP